MIRILDENLVICGTITKYTSIEFVKSFSDYGTFSVQLPRSAGTPEIKKNRIICYKNNFGIIKYIGESDDHIVLKGYDLKYMLAQRVLPGTSGTTDGYLEYVIKTLVNRVLYSNDRRRAFQKLTIAKNLNRGGRTAHTAEKDELLSDAVSKLCGDNYGYDIIVSGGAMVFEICVPRTRTFTYSERHMNVKSCEYTLDALGEKNCFYNTDGDGNKTEVYETAKSGLERCEAISSYSGTTAEIKESVLKDIEASVSETIETEILNPDDYGTKWLLGDYITVKCNVLDGELTVTKQITSVTEVYEPSVHRVTPTFGKAKESVFRKIIRENR